MFPFLSPFKTRQHPRIARSVILCIVSEEDCWSLNDVTLFPGAMAYLETSGWIVGFVFLRTAAFVGPQFVCF